MGIIWMDLNRAASWEERQFEWSADWLQLSVQLPWGNSTGSNISSFPWLSYRPERPNRIIWLCAEFRFSLIYKLHLILIQLFHVFIYLVSLFSLSFPCSEFCHASCCIVWYSTPTSSFRSKSISRDFSRILIKFWSMDSPHSYYISSLVWKFFFNTNTMYVARNWEYSSSLRIKKCSCNKLICAILWHFPVILKHVIYTIWNLWNKVCV
jgi:hypothetical protein